VTTQALVRALQQAPVHEFGVHVVPAPRKTEVFLGDQHWVASPMVHDPLDEQQAPVFVKSYTAIW
jgi:hypothetical protein